jgi:hypothetical protein
MIIGIKRNRVTGKDWLYCFNSPSRADEALNLRIVDSLSESSVDPEWERPPVGLTFFYLEVFAKRVSFEESRPQWHPGGSILKLVGLPPEFRYCSVGYDDGSPNPTENRCWVRLWAVDANDAQTRAKVIADAHKASGNKIVRSWTIVSQ